MRGIEVGDDGRIFLPPLPPGDWFDIVFTTGKEEKQMTTAIRIRFGDAVAYLKQTTAFGNAQPKLGNLVWSPILGKRFGSSSVFRIVGVGHEGDDANVLASWVPTVDVRPVQFKAAA